MGRIQIKVLTTLPLLSLYILFSMGKNGKSEITIRWRMNFCSCGQMKMLITMALERICYCYIFDFPVTCAHNTTMIINDSSEKITSSLNDEFRIVKLLTEKQQCCQNTDLNLTCETMTNHTCQKII